MEKKIICGNCGAEFDDSLPKCPYCNAIYEIGAEREYMEDLGELKEDLSELSEVPEEVYKKEISKNVKKVMVIVLIVIVILLAILGLKHLAEQIIWGSQEVDTKEQMLWEKENFPKLDAWYEDGNYEAILDFQYQVAEEGHYIYDWEHFWFITAYGDYSLCMSQRAVLADKEQLNEDTARFMLSRIMYLLFFLDESFYQEDEWQMIQSWRLDLEEILYKDMKFTEEEAQGLYEKINKDGILDYNTCDQYAKQIWKRFLE